MEEAQRQWRYCEKQFGGELFRSETAMSHEEAFGQLQAGLVLHKLGGWKTFILLPGESDHPTYVAKKGLSVRRCWIEPFPADHVELRERLAAGHTYAA